MNLSAAHVFVNFIPLNWMSKMKFHFMEAFIISHHYLCNCHPHHDDKCGLPEKPPERREVDMKTRTREPVLPCATLKILKILEMLKLLQILNMCNPENIASLKLNVCGI